MKQSDDPKNPSETNWEMINAMTDDMIDRSEVPPLDDSFFERATWRIPQEKLKITTTQESLWEAFSSLPPQAQDSALDFIAFLQSRYTTSRKP